MKKIISATEKIKKEITERIGRIIKNITCGILHETPSNPVKIESEKTVYSESALEKWFHRKKRKVSPVSNTDCDRKKIIRLDLVEFINCLVEAYPGYEDWIVKELCKNESDQVKDTLLFECVVQGNSQLVKSLLDIGATPLFKCFGEQSALGYARDKYQSLSEVYHLSEFPLGSRIKRNAEILEMLESAISLSEHPRARTNPSNIILCDKPIRSAKFTNNPNLVLVTETGQVQTEYVVRLRCKESNQTIREFAPNKRITQVSWSKDKTLLALNIDYNQVLVLNTDTGQEMLHHESTNCVNFMKFSPDNQFCVINELGKNQLSVYSIQTEIKIREIELPSKAVLNLNFSTTGRYLISSDVKQVHLIDFQVGKHLMSIDCNWSYSKLSFSETDQHLFICFYHDLGVPFRESETVCVNLTQLNVIYSHRHANKSAEKNLFQQSKRGSYMTVLRDGCTELIHTRNQDIVCVVPDVDSSIPVSFSDTENRVAILTNSNITRVIDTHTGQTIFTTEFPDEVTCQKLMNHGKYLFVTLVNRTTILCDIDSHEIIYRSNKLINKFRVQMSEDGRYLLINDGTKTVEIVELPL